MINILDVLSYLYFLKLIANGDYGQLELAAKHADGEAKSRPGRKPSLKQTEERVQDHQL